MTQKERGLVEAIHREVLQRFCCQQTLFSNPSAVAYTELPEAKPGEELSHEWNTYCREVARLLSEGVEGYFVVIKEEQILGIWAT